MSELSYFFLGRKVVCWILVQSAVHNPHFKNRNNWYVSGICNCVNVKDQAFCYLIKSQLYVRKYLLPSWFQVCNGNANRKGTLDYSCEGLCRFNSPHSDLLSFKKKKKKKRVWPFHLIQLYI